MGRECWVRLIAVKFSELLFGRGVLSLMMILPCRGREAFRPTTGA